MIPVNRPLVGGAELANLAECVENAWLSSGNYVRRFERAWADFCGRKHGVAVCNGTAALELALRALDLPPGSEVIMPSFTIMSCATAALNNGLVPVLVDVDRDTWNMTPAAVWTAITPATSAVMVTHTYGRPCDAGGIARVAERAGAQVVEDAAQAHGSIGTDTEKAGVWACGSVGAASCFSFYGNKVVACSEGGMVLTDSPTLAARLRSFSNLCFGSGADRFVHTGLGHNYRMGDLQAAVGCAQVASINDLLRRRHSINGQYRAGLAGLPLVWQSGRSGNGGSISNCWVNGFVSDRPAAEVMLELLNRGVESRPFFHPLHLQRALAGRCRYSGCPNSEYLGRHGLYLPSGAGTTDDEVGRVCAAVREVFGQ